MAAKGIMCRKVLVERYQVKDEYSLDENISQELVLATHKTDEINGSPYVLKIEPSEYIVPIIKQEPHDGSPEEGSSFGLIKTDVCTEPVGVKRENETTIGRITYELIDHLPSTLSNNEYKREAALNIEASWGHIEDEYHRNKSSEKCISIPPQVKAIGGSDMKNSKNNAQHGLESRGFNNSRSRMVSNVTVKLVDIFSNEARKKLEVHYNNKSCLCIFCRRVYKDQSNSHLLSIAFKSLTEHNLPSPQPIFAKNSHGRLSNAKIKLLNCPLSPVRCAGASSLKAHKVTHRLRYKCCLCSESCEGETKFQNHMMGAHGIIKPFSCSVCSKSFRQKVPLITHLKIHSDDRPFKCDVCPKSFKIRQHLTFHKQSVHMKEKSQCCNLCSAKFFSKGTLMDHMKSVHSNERPFDCKVCCKSFKLKSHLVKHSRMHSSEKPFKCELCPATFRYPQSAKEHWRIHSDERPYRCSICSKSFKYSSHLQVHERRHTEERPFVCHLCTATFKTRETISHHIRSTHLGEKPKICTICDFKTVSIAALKKHLRAHERMKQIKCPMCPLIFNAVKFMETHVKITHHEGSFDCKLCETKFYNKRSLTEHNKLHMKNGPFKCNLCGTVFSEYLNLEKHNEGHSLCKKFFCAHCPVAFSCKISIKRHLMKLHGL